MPPNTTPKPTIKKSVVKSTSAKTTNAKSVEPFIAPAPPALSSAMPHHSHWRMEWLWLVVPALLASIGWWAGLQRLLEPSLRPDQVGSSLWLTAAIIVAFAFLAGIALIMPCIIHYRWVYPAVGLVLGLPALVFFGVTAAAGLAALILATGLWAASEGAGRETLTRLRIDVRTTMSHVMTWVVLAASLSVALLQYDVVRRSSESQQQIEHLIERIVSAVETVGPKLVENFDPNDTVDELLGSRIPTGESLVESVMTNNRLTTDERAELQEKLETLGISPTAVPATGANAETVRQALDRELRQARSQIIKEFRDGLSKQLGVKLVGDQTIHQALTMLATERSGVRSANFLRFLPPIISLGLFLALRLLSPLFATAAVMAGWFWYRALRLAHVIGVAKVPLVAERLKWGPN